MCLSVWYFFIRYTYSLARHCIETADSGKHEKTDHSLFNGMWRDRSPFFYMAWQIALLNIMWHWPSVTYCISRSLPDEALIIHCVFQQLLQHEVLFVMVFPEALPNDVKMPMQALATCWWYNWKKRMILIWLALFLVGTCIKCFCLSPC